MEIWLNDHSSLSGVKFDDSIWVGIFKSKEEYYAFSHLSLLFYLEKLFKSILKFTLPDDSCFPLKKIDLA